MRYIGIERKTRQWFHCFLWCKAWNYAIIWERELKPYSSSESFETVSRYINALNNSLKCNPAHVPRTLIHFTHTRPRPGVPGEFKVPPTTYTFLCTRLHMNPFLNVSWTYLFYPEPLSLILTLALLFWI